MNKIWKLRIPKELSLLNSQTAKHGISCEPKIEDDFTQLVAKIPGLKDSPYESAVFSVSITPGEQYPFRPATFKFLTPVYHPNIDNSGNICLDLLRMPPTGEYNPALTLESILISIQLLLVTPNANDPLNGEAADLYKNNREKYIEKVREHIEKLKHPVGDIQVMHTRKSKPSVIGMTTNSKRLRLN